MNYRIKSVEVVRYPVLRVTFDDGLSGEYDLTDLIANGPAFARLKDKAYFNTVSVGEHATRSGGTSTILAMRSTSVSTRREFGSKRKRSRSWRSVTG